MSGVYSVEDLLKLRASPLICRPHNLPPIEEWMGSQEPTTKRPTTRGRQDDASLQSEGFQKRPTLDPSLRKSTTDPERIVLGPPRRSFASSNARNLGKAGLHDADEVPKEGIGRHERNRTGDDLDNKLGDRRSGGFGGINGRYSNRHDQDHDKLRRKHDEEDVEGRPQNHHDRPKWGRGDKGHEEADEHANAKSGFKRDPQARSRFEQSWLRDNRGTEEARRENDRSGWRRDRVKDGDWDTPGKADLDPEWMDAPHAMEPAQAHTQEEFQRWKEQMKKAANGPTDEKQEPPSTLVASVVDNSKQSQGLPPLGLTSPDLNANSMDKFFAKFGEKKTTTEDKPVTAKPGSKSKFASLFSPPPVEVKQDPIDAAPAPASPVVAQVINNKPSMPLLDHSNSTEADQAGFKRILEMLGKREATPTEAPKSRSNTVSNEQQSQEQQQSPDLVAIFKQNEPSRQTPVSQPPPGLERLIESRSPASGHRRQETPNKDELLLNLLRQADIATKPFQQPQREYVEQRPPPGLFASMNEPSRNEPRQMHDDRPDVSRQVPMQQRPGRSIFDDPAISSVSYQDEIGTRQGLQRRPTNGYEDSFFDRLRQQEQKPMPPPPGMPRPPGLEQLSRMPPGWAPPQHQPARQGPPPGINMPRGMQPPFGAPQQGPMPPMPQQQGQRPPQRKYTGESSMPSYPPGFGPPPGLMNGPPPGFHPSNATQNQGYGRYGMAGEAQGHQHQAPPNMGRAFMEMYGSTERGGLRGSNGGVPLPPGLR